MLIFVILTLFVVMAPWQCPRVYYFVMGDNRSSSSDSRHWGFVPKKYIVGRVWLPWWPLSGIHRF